MLFLDAGNTLMSMDFAWISRELADLGHDVKPEKLARAEAAARPVVSRELHRGRSTEGLDLFRFYLERGLERCLELPDDDLAALAAALVPRIRRPGESDILWSAVLPGVPESLERLAAAGLRLVVVSNSDGSIERGIERAGLRRYFEAVIDSQVVGFEKPDPRIFRHALEIAGAEPERALHAGDMYGADINGARAAGVHAVLLDPHDDWNDVDCPKIRDVAALADVLLG